MQIEPRNKKKKNTKTKTILPLPVNFLFDRSGCCVRARDCVERGRRNRSFFFCIDEKNNRVAICAREVEGVSEMPLPNKRDDDDASSLKYN